MKQILITVLFAVLLMSSLAYSQWTNSGAWPNDTYQGQLHGIAVDPDGKVWAGNFSAEPFVTPDNDTINVRLLKVFNPDGSEASFSPIWRVTVGSQTDTLWNSVRGMRADQNGNIIYLTGGEEMWRFNYQTGEGMNFTNTTLATSPTAPAIADNGNIFVGPVVNAGSKIEEYDTDFNYLGDAVTFTLSGFSRSMEVSPDGNTIYFPSYSRGLVIVYQRPDELSPFDSVGTIMDGVHCESISWNKATGKLWVAGGSYNDLPDPGSPWTPGTWYEYDVNTASVGDSIKWAFVNPGDPGERPRGIGFSPDGSTAYIGVFGAAGLPLVQKVDGPSDVNEQGQVVVNGYKLSQNYPNPFNPSTKISFELPNSGFVTLKVYDMLGREVAVLVDKEMATGSHIVDFNAANLASGTYIYRLTANGTVLTNKMTLLK